MPKPFWQSKTFWFNLLFALVMIANQLGFTHFNPDPNTAELIALAVAVVNIILRFITTRPIGQPRPEATKELC